MLFIISVGSMLWGSVVCYCCVKTEPSLLFADKCLSALRDVVVDCLLIQLSQNNTLLAAQHCVAVDCPSIKEQECPHTKDIYCPSILDIYCPSITDQTYTGVWRAALPSPRSEH